MKNHCKITIQQKEGKSVKSSAVFGEVNHSNKALSFWKLNFCRNYLRYGALS